MEVLLLAVMGATNLLCFIYGAKVGQSVSKGEKVEVPSMNPMEAVREHQAKKEAKFQQTKNEIILENIESYDGTPYGQKDVPKG